MALLPMGSSTDERTGTQETMFEEPDDYQGLESQEAAYEDAEQLSYEAAEDFSTGTLGFASAEPSPGSVAESSVGVSSETQIETGLEAGLEPGPESGVGSGLDSGPEPTLIPFQPELHASHTENNTVVVTEAEPMTVLTIDDFAALEERVLRAVSLVRREREARTAADERAASAEAKLQAQLETQDPAIERLEQEVESLRAEREQVRQRVERLLGQLDALEL